MHVGCIGCAVAGMNAPVSEMGERCQNTFLESVSCIISVLSDYWCC